jgi:hypothetical protein
MKLPGETASGLANKLHDPRLGAAARKGIQRRTDLHPYAVELMDPRQFFG